VTFFAYDKQYPGTEPVYDFWHQKDHEHTFHFDPPWPNEERRCIQFYAFRHQVPGTEPVYDYWHHKHKEHTFHMGDAWEGETKNKCQFYAYRTDPGAVEIALRKVRVDNVKVQLATKVLGMSAHVDNVRHDDFTSEFNAHGAGEITYLLLRSLTPSIAFG